MDARKPSIDLATELTCSICTELLYHPLTLLDCLHTFCGACLKAWFGFQKERIERSPSPPAPDAVLFTCPCCRAAVRDTKHNATVVTLLDMYITAKPDKERSDLDKKEMNAKYQPGDLVIPHITTRERTAQERRDEEEDRRLMEHVREMSLREAASGVPLQTSPRRGRESRATEEHLSSRPTRDDTRPRRSTAQLGLLSDGHRRGSSESQERQVGHQSSLRSLISSADLNEHDIEREIEDFARQIQEEGLLDGLDLDNIDLARDEEFSRRITEAYRRRQRNRTTNLSARRVGSTIRAEQTMRDADSRLEPQPRRLESNSPARSRGASTSRSAAGSSQTDEQDRRSPSSAANLQVRQRRTGSRRRAVSGSYVATVLTDPTESFVRPAARSHTDLTLQTDNNASSTLRPNTTTHVRSSSVPSAAIETSVAGVSAPTSFSSRVARSPASNAAESRRTSMGSRDPSTTRPSRAAEPLAGHPTPAIAAATGVVRPENQSPKSQLYPEPSITCSRCNKLHIEYEVHYNCSICAGGLWSMCFSCYRSGRGCLHWFGFGHGGWNKWKRRLRQGGEETLAPPHILTASRYRPPPSTPGGADGRKTLTKHDPQLRLETGVFCARCQAWANECYWRCDICNDGEWGYCSNCVNQGRSCTHSLLPLSHDLSQPHSRIHDRPKAPLIATERLETSIISPFKPLSIAATCDVCHNTIMPSNARYHCYSCTSSLVGDASPGDYDICSPCYGELVGGGQISQENGHSGWRRCLKGHRMVVIEHSADEAGQWRHVQRDLVGGRKLRVEPLGDDDAQSSQPFQKWSWKQDSGKLERLVAQRVSSTVPKSSQEPSTYTLLFPPDGGNGLRVLAKWAWYPREDADDELLFPRGAEIREAENVNGDWFFGVYMGAKGLFPSNYVSYEGDDGS